MTCVHHAPNSDSKFYHYIERVDFKLRIVWMVLIKVSNEQVQQHVSIIMQQTEIQNLTIRLVECGEILLFVTYKWSDCENEVVKSCKTSSKSNFGQTSKLVPSALDLIILG